MRKYFQGTLDYACGIYAVVNALSCTHAIALQSARAILEEAFLSLPQEPFLWKKFIRNETDHYWVVRRTLGRWCFGPFWFASLSQPFGDALLPEDDEDFTRAGAYLPEKEEPRGPASSFEAEQEAITTWRTLEKWLEPQSIADTATRRRAAIFRFHRFILGLDQPVVSHWTAACSMSDGMLWLHDASVEEKSVHCIAYKDVVPGDFLLASLRIVPESIVFVERQ